MDATGQPLIQSDGSSDHGGSESINENVPAGIDYVEVESLGAGGSYEIRADVGPDRARV